MTFNVIYDRFLTMKWILFTGTWRLTNKKVEEDVRNAVRDCVSHGYGIVTGGATGVDYFCMDECIKNNYLNKLRVFIPSNLDHYISDYGKNWCHEPINKEDILDLENVLKNIKQNNPSRLLEMKHNGGIITQDDHYGRHNEEVMFSDEVYAFQVNESKGTQDTINKAIESGLICSLHKKYTI